MDTVMQQQDFLQPLLDLMNKRMDAMEIKVDNNTKLTNEVLAQARHTNGRVTKAEQNILDLQARRGKKWDVSPNLLYLIALAVVIVLLIIASLMDVSLKGVL